MAQPQAYNRETDFTERDGDDTNHPGINIELDAAAQSINEIRDNLALIQRDDGALQNGIVTAESLAPSAFDAVLVEVNLAVTDAQTAATSANNAAVSANTARDQAVAAKDTAVTSASAAALNATTATTKATEAAASATAAQASATASGNSAAASQTSRLASEAARDASQAAQAAAAASQTATATSETNASASAATATAQAGIATTQAGIATTQASNAAASATAAAASFDQFDDRYLGSKTSDPTTDNDGNALLSGALYFNSVAGEMRVWADTFWKATGSSVGGTINTAKYTATAGQTTFAIVYDVGFVHVYLNGVKLESGVKFTANNGTSVVLATGATAGDVVDMIAFGIFSVANTYTKAEADALLGAKAPQATTYTKTEVDTALAGKQSSLGYTPVNKAGDTMTGPLTLGGKLDRQLSGDATAIEIRGSYSGNQKIFEVAQVGSDGVLYVRDAVGNTSKIASHADDTSVIRGRVTLPQQPAFFAYRSLGAGHISGTGNGVFDATRFNRGGHYSTSNGRFTAPVGGVYFFTALGLPLGTVNYTFLALFKNGVGYSANTYVINADQSIAISAAIELAAGDYVTAYFIDGSEQSYSHFSGFLIG